MINERLWAFQGVLIVFGISVLILPDPVVFPNKDSNLGAQEFLSLGIFNVVEEIKIDFNSNSSFIIYLLYDLKQVIL